MVSKPPSLVPFMVVVVLVFVCLQSFGAKASVHDYRGQKFFGSGNAFVLHGGSEGLFASRVSFNSSDPNGGSFVRYGC
jgi:hypothetical protein